MQVPADLIEQLQRNNVVLLIGEGVDRGFLPQLAEITNELAAECQFPEEQRSFAHVAEYYAEDYASLNALAQFLKDRLSPGRLHPPELYQALAGLPVQTIITTCYHRQFERFLDSKQIPYTRVLRESQVSSISNDRRTLVWLWGSLEDPETLRITDDERRRFLTVQETFARAIRERLAGLTWLCVGVDADDKCLREFYEQAVLKPDRNSRPPYFIGPTASRWGRSRWEKNSSARFLGDDIAACVDVIVTRLRTQADPRKAEADSHNEEQRQLLPQNPYSDLDAFDERSRDRFFGRRLDIERIARRVESNRLFVLYGASGVGKTSLLQAGLAPLLGRADPPYTVVFVRAFEDLRQKMRDALHKKLADVTLAADQPLAPLLAAAARACPGWLLIVFDQFEEFFINTGGQARDTFIADLKAINEDQELNVKMVFSLREDWLPHMDPIEQRLPRLAKLRLGPLTRAQAREAIELPTKQLNISYEPELVERLLGDLSGDSPLTQGEVMPPQLQIVCARLFDARASDQFRLTAALYQDLGGAQQILNNYLSETLRTFAPARQQLAYRALEELVTAYGTKAVKDLEELARDTEAAPEVLQQVLGGMVERRLLRTVEIRPGQFGYELAHEYLIQRHDLDDPSTRRRREQEKLLKQEVETWRHYGYLIGSNRLAALFELRHELHLSPAMQELLLRSALETGHRVEEWAATVEDQGQRMGILLEVATGSPEAGRAAQTVPAQGGVYDATGSTQQTTGD